MKIIVLLFSLAFLFWSTLATCTTDTPNRAFETILDTEGNPLNTNSRYFIVSAICGGGGVMVANLGNQAQNDCPTSVVLSQNHLDDGKSVYIIPNDPKHDIITEMSTVNIKFYLDSPTCSHYAMWKVDNFPNFPSPAEQYNISTGEQSIGSTNMNMRFQIKSLGGWAYKLVFCPFGDKFTCQNVGIDDENGVYCLALEENAKEFVFKRDKRIGMAIV